MALHCTVWTNFLLTGFEKSMFSVLLMAQDDCKLGCNKEAAHRLKAMRRLDEYTSAFYFSDFSLSR
ncbi:MAG: hypothetical protein DESF_01776 [Desulfovibrio sp.]